MMAIGYTWVYGVELDEAVVETEADLLDRMSPHRDPHTPAVYLGWISEAPEARYPEDDFSEAGSRVVKRYGSRLLQEFRSRHTKKEGALSKHEGWLLELKGRGWNVVTPPIRREFNVYVIELASEILEERSEFRDSDRDKVSELPPVYVGMTQHTPAERFRRHQEGDVTASSYVKEYGVRLRTDLYSMYNPLTELEAFRKERDLARRLRNVGYEVAGGH